MRGTPVRSLLLLQVLLTLSKYYIPVFFVPTILLFIYKDYKLPYPDSVIGWEIAFCCLYVFIDAGRISAGTRGNKTETVGPMIWSILLALPVLALHAYYFAFQTYVLRLDQILNGIPIVVTSVEVLMSIVALCRFHRYNQL